jgi:hypothetical protein
MSTRRRAAARMDECRRTCGSFAGSDTGIALCHHERSDMAHDIDTVLGWRGSTVVDRDGEKIGSLKELYLDQDERPAWGGVHTGLFGLRQTFVPLAGAQPVDGGIQIPFAKDHVKDAPSIDPDTQLSDEEERRLYRHYELPAPADDEDDDEAQRDAGAPAAAPADERAGAPAAEAADARGDERAAAPVREPAAEPAGETQAEPETGAPAREVARGEGDGGDVPDAMTRSEEELVVGTRRRVRGKARLKKYVVTEHVQRTIPVQREEVRVEFDPAAPEDEAAETAEGTSRDRDA